jgi:hypothetical protein
MVIGTSANKCNLGMVIIMKCLLAYIPYFEKIKVGL